ncbi:MAG: glycosyltransferase, partial [Nanoarchaeota archaeon]
MKGNFIFYDARNLRFKTLTKYFLAFLFLTDLLALFLLFSIYSEPNFNNSKTGSNRKEISETIDILSTKQKDLISLAGSGAAVKIEGTGREQSLQKYGNLEGNKIIFTFDDGPDAHFTPQILDILKRENIKAVFFVIGENLLKNPDIAKRIVDEGHQIGVHTFSHAGESFDLTKNSLKPRLEIDTTQKIIQDQTGIETRLFRVPFWGTEETISMNSLILSVNALSRGYTVLSSTLDSNDWKEVSVSKIVSDGVDEQGNVILFHDGGGNRKKTVDALPYIIKLYKDRNFKFGLVDENLLGKNVTIHQRISFLEKVIARSTVLFLVFPSYFYSFVKGFFVVSIFAFSVNALIFLSLIAGRIFLKKAKKLTYKPYVSVIVPCYNEARTIKKTLTSILRSDYHKFEIVVVDNNSKDKTREKVTLFKKYKIVRLLKEKKQGKFAALNRGVRMARGAIVVIIDADTQILKDTLRNLVESFSSRKIAAVAGNVKVGNVKNLLTALQAIEYIVGLNLDRRAYSNLGSIPIVPGALG